MKTILSAVFLTTISTSLVFAADHAVMTTPPTVTMPADQQSQETEKMKKSIRVMFGELAKNKTLLQEMTGEILKEAVRNKEFLKDIIREITRDRETLRSVIKDLLTDKEFQKTLKEDRKLFEELLNELSRTEFPDKPMPEKQ